MDELSDLTYTGPQIQAILDEAHKLLEGVYATENWVTNQLSGLASQSWVTQQGYATQTWITQQGFATQTWVNQQGFATQNYVTTQLADYLPLTGGSLDGSLAIGDSNTSYTLTLNGQTVTPGGGGTDENVKQNAGNDNADYRILLSYNANDTTETEEVRKSGRLKFNPYTLVLTIGTSGADLQTITPAKIKSWIDAASDLSDLTSTLGALAFIDSLSASDIPNLPASKINSGEFDTARIPSLDASKITSGTFDAARIPSLSYLPLSGGTLTGGLRLQRTDTSYGIQTRLNFGDNEEVYIEEDSDQHMVIHADKGLNVTTNSGYVLSVNGTTLDNTYQKKFSIKNLGAGSADIGGFSNIYAYVITSSGNVELSYLPLIGGTLLGSLAIGNSSTNYTLTLNGQAITAGGGGISMTDVWNALAGNTSEQINASHIPSLSYLPLGGGTLTGKLTIGAANNKVGMQLYGPLNIDSAAGASSKIYWGDGSYVWVGEDSDDHLGINGSHGIGMSVGSSYSTTIAVGTNTILTVNSSGVSIGNSNSNLSLTLNGQTITPGGGGISMTDVWNGLAGATNEQINVSHLSTALSGYATTNSLGDLALLDDIATSYVTALTSYSKGSSSAALETADTLNQALSKLECKADTSAKRIGQYQGYGTCTGSTTTSGATRNVTLEGYDFQDNGVIVVKFTYANGANMKLSVNSKTAKNVRYNGANITAGTITAGETVTLVYADTYYNLIKTTTTYYAGTLLAIGYDGKNYSILSSLETSFLMPSSLSGYATETWADNKFLQLSGGTVEGDVYIGALNSNKDLTVYGNIQTSYCKLNNSENNPFLKLSHKYNNVSSTWYVQAHQGVLGIGMGIANSVKIDGSGNIEMISGSHIQFNYTYGSNNYWSQINTSPDGLQIEGTPNQKYALDVNGHIHTTGNLYVDGYLYFDTNVYIYWSSGHLYLKNGSAAAQIIV